MWVLTEQPGQDGTSRCGYQNRRPHSGGEGIRGGEDYSEQLAWIDPKAKQVRIDERSFDERRSMILAMLFQDDKFDRDLCSSVGLFLPLERCDVTAEGVVAGKNCSVFKPESQLNIMVEVAATEKYGMYCFLFFFF